MIQEEKKRLRKEIKDLKKKITQEEKLKRSEQIWQKLEKDHLFQKAGTVMVYWSMKGEVHTHDFIKRWYPEKHIILPVVKGDILVLKSFSGMENMKEGESFGILEPTGEAFENLSEIDLVMVPGIAFDKRNNRLGRGKAYYDKLLQKLACPRYGVCFGFQLVDEVPADHHDIKMDKVITD